MSPTPPQTDLSTQQPDRKATRTGLVVALVTCTIALAATGIAVANWVQGNIYASAAFEQYGLTFSANTSIGLSNGAVIEFDADGETARVVDVDTSNNTPELSYVIQTVGDPVSKKN